MKQYQEKNGKTGLSLSLHPRLCGMGGKLRKVKGSTCANCYAFRGRIHFGNVIASLMRNYDQYLTDPNWVEHQAERIGNAKLFRWFSRGDLLSYSMLLDIVDVCKLTPNTRHWLPTKEVRYLAQFKREGRQYPDNLCVRLSSFMVDKPHSKLLLSKLGVGTHNVSTKKWDCEAKECGDCDTCWDRSVECITFKLKTR
jgi:hypothetical protein